MRLIDTDELELDTEWSDYYDGFTSYSQSQINEAEEVKAIPLDRIKEAREEVARYQSIHDSYCEHIEKRDFWDGHTPNHYESSGGKATACDYLLQIIDKLIEEVDKCQKKKSIK